MDIPLSDHNLRELCLEMNERANVLTINEILTNNLDKEKVFKHSGHVILFYNNPGQSVGHWLTCIRKPDDTVYLFDSLSEPYEKYGIHKWLNKHFKKVYYNPYKFQRDDTNTCGKYCLLCIALNKLQFTYKEIEDFFKLVSPCDDYILNIFQ